MRGYAILVLCDGGVTALIPSSELRDFCPDFQGLYLCLVSIPPANGSLCPQKNLFIMKNKNTIKKEEEFNCFFGRTLLIEQNKL